MARKPGRAQRPWGGGQTQRAEPGLTAAETVWERVTRLSERARRRKAVVHWLEGHSALVVLALVLVAAFIALWGEG